MKVAYVSDYDASDIRQWSGTGYYMARSLEQQAIAIEFIGPLESKIRFRAKLKKLSNRIFIRRRYLPERSPVVLQYYAEQAEAKLRNANVDVVFSPGTFGISYLRAKQPIAFWTDATFGAMIDFYPSFSNLAPESIRDGNIAEQDALDRCRLAIYSSEWAANSAINLYGADPRKVKVVCFGANLKSHRTFEDIKTLAAAKSKNCCRLLFLGVEWFRKGGPMALQVASTLNQMGLPTELQIVGCTPPNTAKLPSFVKVLGFLSKKTAEGRNTLNRLFEQAHFLIVPSLAECTPIVFCEAASFGVPCLSTTVGGIPTIILNDINGKIFPKSDPANKYAEYIIAVMSNPRRYQDLALSSFGEYETRLNWNSAGKKVKQLLSELS